LFPLKSAVSAQLSALSRAGQAGANPRGWGLRGPEGTGQGEGGNLPELRLRRIADVPKQRLRQPTTLSFLFIDISGSFVQILLSAISFQLSAMPVRLAQTPEVGVCDVSKGQVRTSGAIWRPCAFGASQTFQSNVCASPGLFDLSFLFIDISGSFVQIQLSALSHACQAGADP